jgi:hypothetical protein
MEYSNEKQLLAQFEKPDTFKENVQTLKQQLPPILDDFNKYFVLYNKDPNNPDFENMFNNIKQNLNTIGSSLFMVSNDLDTNIDNINATYKKLDILIVKERKRNRELRRKLGLVERENDSSKELIDNYNEMYDMDYLRNWGLFLSTIVVGVYISKNFNLNQ